MPTEIQKRLLKKQDLIYRDFNAKLIPTLEKEAFIGVRFPFLRSFSKELLKSYDSFEVENFINSLPHSFHEENCLHAMIIEKIADFEKCAEALDVFLPFVNNWQTCDLMSPMAFKNNPEKAILKIREWLKSEHPYTVRFAIKLLMNFFLDENFNPEYFEWVLSVKSDEYYLKMMAAWYFATALSKRYEEAEKVLTEKRLSAWVHNKTIQKAIESHRITAEQKMHLKTLKIKE